MFAVKAPSPRPSVGTREEDGEIHRNLTKFHKITQKVLNFRKKGLPETLSLSVRDPREGEFLVFLSYRPGKDITSPPKGVLGHRNRKNTLLLPIQNRHLGYLSGSGPKLRHAENAKKRKKRDFSKMQKQRF